jgi:Lhr-like helicase
MSAGLIYDVLCDYEPTSPMLRQANDEVLQHKLDRGRIARALEMYRLQRAEIEVDYPTPFGFPLYVRRVGARLSSESLATRIERMKASWTKTT